MLQDAAFLLSSRNSKVFLFTPFNFCDLSKKSCEINLKNIFLYTKYVNLSPVIRVLGDQWMVLVFGPLHRIQMKTSQKSKNDFVWAAHDSRGNATGVEWRVLFALTGCKFERLKLEKQGSKCNFPSKLTFKYHPKKKKKCVRPVNWLFAGGVSSSVNEQKPQETVKYQTNRSKESLTGNLKTPVNSTFMYLDYRTTLWLKSNLSLNPKICIT